MMLLFGGLVWLVSVSQMSAFFTEDTEFRWSIKVRHLKDDFKFYPGPVSILNRPIKSTAGIDIASFPQDRTNQAAGLDHQATPHIAEVQILDKNGTASVVALSGLFSSGIVPTAKLLYPSPTGDSLDSGKSILKIHGMIYDNEAASDSRELFLLYPLPISGHETVVHFTLPIFTFGQIGLLPFRKPLHLSNITEEVGGQNVQVSLERNPNWLPEMNTNDYVMAFLLSEDNLLISTDEFENIWNVSLRELPDAVIKCPDAIGAVIPFQKDILYLSKKGPIFLESHAEGTWMPTQSLTVFGRNDVCLRKVAVSPPSYFKKILVASSKRSIYIANSTGLSSTKELVDLSGSTVCNAALLAENSCEIIDQAFDSASCCDVYVLLKNLVSSSYVLLKYIGYAFEGHWNTLTRFSSILPKTGEYADRLVFLDPAKTYTGRQFKISGISTLTIPDGSLYMWGDVLLAYDIRSGILAWIPSFFPGKDDVAVQFSSANEKGMYAIFSKKGAAWVGSAYPFEKHYTQLLQLIPKPGKEDCLALFFDSLDMLYGITATAVGKGYSFARKEILNASSSDSQCKRTYSCNRLFLKCNAESSAFHINHTMYSRTRHFSIVPPRLTRKARKSNLIHPLYNGTSLLTYLTVMDRFFTGQKIGVARWWLDDSGNRAKKELKDWWYTQDAALEKHRKYLYVADLLPNQPLMYLEKAQYLQEIIHPPEIYETWDTSYCKLPAIIYLDKDQKFCFEVIVEHALAATHLDFDDLTLVVISSDNSVLDVTTVRHVESFNVLYEVILTGKAMTHKPAGEFLTTVSVTFYPINPPEEACCSSIAKKMAFEQNMLVKVGCPPGRRLKFDTRRSSEILFSRGRTEDFECLYKIQDDIPCFTTSEFVAAFSIEDLVTGGRTPFEGNYTLQVIAGGVGHLENVKQYTKEEVQLFNYSPGDSKSLLNLIWSVLLESSSKGMRDETTGRLIFDAKNPASIVFECRLRSPCGNIPFGAYNPGEFYLDIEVSNVGVDSSTNCDYTTRFMIHLVGIELSQNVHFQIMLVTLSILFTLAVLYYLCNFAGGRRILSTCSWNKVDDFGSPGDTESERSDSRPPYAEVLNKRRLTLGGGTRRSSMLTQGLLSNPECGKRNSSAVPNTRSNTSRGSQKKMN